VAWAYAPVSFVSAVRAWALTAFTHGAWAHFYPLRRTLNYAQPRNILFVRCAPSRYAPRPFVHSVPPSVLIRYPSAPSPLPLRSHAARALPPACGRAASPPPCRRNVPACRPHMSRSRGAFAPLRGTRGERTPSADATGAQPPPNQEQYRSLVLLCVSKCFTLLT